MSVTINGSTGITTPNTLTVEGNNISSANSLGFRNRIINGDMRIDQRNAGAALTIPTGSSTYTVDRWQANKDTSGITLTVQQSSVAPSGFNSSLLFTATVGGSPTSLQYLSFQQKVEGFNASDFSFGTANASAVALSFWVRSSITGTYAACLKNSANDRSYVATYTINAANTWEQKTLTIAGDTTGTWFTTNGIGVRVGFDLGSGSGYNTTAGAWVAGDFFRTSGTVNWGATSGATFYITGVQLEAGTVATPFERRDYGRELMLAQRYFQIVKTCTGHVNGAANGIWRATSPLPVTLRASPSIAIVGTPTFLLAASTGRVVLTGIETNQATNTALQYDGTFGSTYSGLNGAIATMESSNFSYLTVSAEL